MQKMHRMAVSRIARKIAIDDDYIAALLRDEVNQVTGDDKLPKAS